MNLPQFLTAPDPSIYQRGKYVVLDFETSAIKKGSALESSNKLILACWIDVNGRRKHHFGPEYDQQDLLDSIAEADFIVAHHARFELQWLARCGLDIRSVVCYDTMLGEWVIAGNRDHALSLDATARRYGIGAKEDLVNRLIKLGVDPENGIPKDWLLEYCEQDVELTLRIMECQLKELAQSNRLHLQYARCLLTPALADMESQGLTLDKKQVTDEYVRVSNEFKELQEKLYEISGGINLRSGLQLGELLYDKLGFQELKVRGVVQRTSSDRRKTDAATLSRLVAKTTEQREFIEVYKKLARSNALLTKALKFFKAIVDDHDCTFFGDFNQGNTQTHRLSSSGRPIEVVVGTKKNGTLNIKRAGVQLQNIPREYKKLFKAKNPEWLVCDIDGSQLEFRVAGDLARDKVALHMISTGEDVHTDTKLAYKAAGEDISRQEAKPLTFKPLFGGQGSTPAEQAYCKFFKNKYKEIAKMQEGWTYEVLRTKELVTPYGMRFYWPDTSISRSGYITNTTNIYNYPVN